MEEAHKAVLKRKRVCDDEIIPVPDEIRDRNSAHSLQVIVTHGGHTLVGKNQKCLISYFPYRACDSIIRSL